ncbi:hypothetical protein BSLG_005001 [Batrachochytrium salamandrivorans]|nr:hypothetical protein BSLG_005001 [Batrachochytrium salamandrivorans]
MSNTESHQVPIVVIAGKDTGVNMATAMPDKKAIDSQRLNGTTTEAATAGIATSNAVPKVQKEMSFSPLGFISLEWLTPMLLLGARQPLQTEAEYVSHALDKFWTEYRSWASNPNKTTLKPPSLFNAVFQNYYLSIFLGMVCMSISIACSLAVPTFIQQVIYFLIPQYPRALLLIQSGPGLAFVLFALQLSASIFGLLRLSGKSSVEFTQGKILNLVNVDSEKIANAIQSINGLYATPIQIVVAVYLLGQLLGVSVWAGAGTLFFVLLLQGGIIGFFVKYQKLFLSAGDKRLKALREVLYGIKIIKFRALEEFFSDRITLTPVAMPIVAFIAFSLLNGGISAPVIFPALSLFSILFQPLLVLPGSLTGVILAGVSWVRIRDFLLAEEAESFSIINAETTPGAPKDVAIQLTDATFRWEVQKTEAKKAQDSKNAKTAEKKEKSTRRWMKKSSATDTPSSATIAQQETDMKDESVLFHLRNITTLIKKGSLVVVVGPVGSGKSSFLSGIIGEMRCRSGALDIYGSLGYCSQQAWILTETIQGNIMFNSPLNQTRLDAVIKASCLSNDLHQFPSGRMTQIGEKGVNLSGGQKARVSLARAMYQDCDTYLLDDPISALDAHVGAEVFDLSIKKMLKGKTVVLVTHQLHFLPEADHVIVMGNGTIAEQGTFTELMANKSGVLADMMKHYRLDDANDDKTAEAGEKTVIKAEKDASSGDSGDIIIDEDRLVGAVKGNTYWSYVQACGGTPYIITVAFAAIFAQATRLLTDIWLTWWTENRFPNLTTMQYLQIYSGLGGSQVVFSLILNTSILVGGYHSAHYYHAAALKRLMAAPMSFYDSQPIGRILNRMSKDVESIDQAIWILLFLTIISSTGLLSIAILMAYVVPYMLLLIVPLIVLYVFIIKYYQNANRELKRIESIQRSPLYAHISETLVGLATVKAFRVEDRFVKRQRELMNLIIRQYAQSSRFRIGIALTYAIALTSLINLLLMAFSQLDAEHARSIKTPPVGKWPTSGAISFKNLEIRYESRPDFAVIKNLSLDIQPGEKVGIVGRTGSGKSTLMTALFRIVEPTLGCMELDGVDIGKIGLKTLRKRLQIIPQEPVLFTGTIRENLDVESKFQDVEIWDVLSLVGLKEYVMKLPDKLEAAVVENGENLSVGQCQLICLGRAILMKPIVLVMDEATASVDTEADKLIQQSIKTHFAHSTVISIAHRLNIIVDFDRVVVLQDGELAEFDSPHVLLGRPTSLFSQLADATGVANAQLLRSIAAKKAASL